MARRGTFTFRRENGGPNGPIFRLTFSGNVGLAQAEEFRMDINGSNDGPVRVRDPGGVFTPTVRAAVRRWESRPRSRGSGRRHPFYVEDWLAGRPVDVWLYRVPQQPPATGLATTIVEAVSKAAAGAAGSAWGGAFARFTMSPAAAALVPVVADVIARQVGTAATWVGSQFNFDADDDAKDAEADLQNPAFILPLRRGVRK